jgi:hypothetical protein
VDAHLAISYSTGEQPAAPVIAELGKTVPGCEVTIDQLSLVVQNGPEQLWDWRVTGAARLGGHSAGPPFLRHPEPYQRDALRCAACVANTSSSARHRRPTENGR